MSANRIDPDLVGLLIYSSANFPLAKIGHTGCVDYLLL